MGSEAVDHVEFRRPGVGGSSSAREDGEESDDGEEVEPCA